MGLRRLLFDSPAFRLVELTDCDVPHDSPLRSLSYHVANQLNKKFWVGLLFTFVGGARVS